LSKPRSGMVLDDIIVCRGPSGGRWRPPPIISKISTFMDMATRQSEGRRSTRAWVGCEVERSLIGQRVPSIGTASMPPNRRRPRRTVPRTNDAPTTDRCLRRASRWMKQSVSLFSFDFERALGRRGPEPRAVLARPGQAAASSRTARSGLRLVYGRLRHPSVA